MIDPVSEKPIIVHLSNQAYPWYQDPELFMRKDKKGPLAIISPDYILVGQSAVDEFLKIQQTRQKLLKTVRRKLKQFKLPSDGIALNGLVRLCSGDKPIGELCLSMLRSNRRKKAV